MPFGSDWIDYSEPHPLTNSSIESDPSGSIYGYSPMFRPSFERIARIPKIQVSEPAYLESYEPQYSRTDAMLA